MFVSSLALSTIKSIAVAILKDGYTFFDICIIKMWYLCLLSFNLGGLAMLQPAEYSGDGAT